MEERYCVLVDHEFVSQLAVGSPSGAQPRSAREATGWLSGTTIPGAIVSEES